MTHIVLENLKSDYKDGFRCIHAEIKNDAYTMHLKNFDNEKIKTLTTSNPYEISMIKHYLDSIEELKENCGYEY